MQRPLQITFRNMKPSEAVEARIKKDVEKLEFTCNGYFVMLTPLNAGLQFQNCHHRL